MAPRLRVLAGTSPSTMVPITSVVNTGKSHNLSSPLFEGQVVAHVHGLTDEDGQIRDSEYFAREDRKGVTWSIQVQGRFLVPYSADDILFGNTFDRPLKLPWGTSAVLKFMHYIDPTLDHDLLSHTKPWALSPLVSTMPYLAHKHVAEGTTLPAFPTKESLVDDTSELYLALDGTDSASVSDGSDSTGSSVSSPASSASSLSSQTSKSSGRSKKSTESGPSSGFKAAMKKVAASSSVTTGKSRKSRSRSKMARELREFKTPSERRGYFANKERRNEIIFGPEDVITTDFCYGFINFAPSLSLQLPGGLSFDLMRYWDGQPVRFVCCERKGTSTEEESDDPWGRTFWCVAIEMVEG